jgi:hypothetical protein
MSWLEQTPEIKCFQDEVWALSRGKPERLVRLIYNKLGAGNFKRGYKVS